MNNKELLSIVIFMLSVYGLASGLFLMLYFDAIESAITFFGTSLYGFYSYFNINPNEDD